MNCPYVDRLQQNAAVRKARQSSHRGEKGCRRSRLSAWTKSGKKKAKILRGDVGSFATEVAVLRKPSFPQRKKDPTVPWKVPVGRRSRVVNCNTHDVLQVAYGTFALKHQTKNVLPGVWRSALEATESVRLTPDRRHGDGPCFSACAKTKTNRKNLASG